MDNRRLRQTELGILIQKMVRAVIDGGISQREVARLYGFTETTVSKHVRSFKRCGERGLLLKKHGRPASTIQKLTDSQQEELCQIIEKSTPDEEGLECVLWTRRSVKELIERRFKVSYALRSITDVLKKLGFTPQKPIKMAIQKDAMKVQKWFEVEYPTIKARASKESASIHWGDEMGLRSSDQRGRTYGKKGNTPTIRKTASRFSCNMIATITNYGSMKWMVFEENFTVPIFINFLRRLTYKADKKIFLILDNHSVHHAKKVKEWILKHNDKIELFFLPPYSPELNPQELVNQEVKGTANNLNL